MGTPLLRGATESDLVAADGFASMLPAAAPPAPKPRTEPTPGPKTPNPAQPAGEKISPPRVEQISKMFANIDTGQSKRWYKEGDSFEEYTLRRIAPSGKSIDLFNDKERRLLTIAIQ